MTWVLTEEGKKHQGAASLRKHLEEFGKYCFNSFYDEKFFVVEGMGIGVFYTSKKRILFSKDWVIHNDDLVVAIVEE